MTTGLTPLLTSEEGLLMKSERENFGLPSVHPQFVETKGCPANIFRQKEVFMERPKFMQIAGTAATLYALDSDGNVWTYVPPVPPYEGRSGLGDWWKPLQMRTESEGMAAPTHEKK
jgi:hypothetical protein